MIADLIESTDIRLITKNVMAVYSTNKEYTDHFIRRLKTHNYLVDGNPYPANAIISYVKKTYNIYENIYRFTKRHKDINFEKFVEYLNFLGLNHLLWLHFYQLSKDNLLVVEILLQLSTDKKIVIIDYIDQLECKEKLYSLLFQIGLEDRLVIVPFSDVSDAVNYSTCQCYVKSYAEAKIQSRFSEEYINNEFKTHVALYKSDRPKVYLKDNNAITPASYKYTAYELVMIFLFSLKMLLVNLNYWRLKIE